MLPRATLYSVINATWERYPSGTVGHTPYQAPKTALRTQADQGKYVLRDELMVPHVEVSERGLSRLERLTEASSDS